MPDDALIVFAPSGRRGRVAHGVSVLEAARSLGVDLDSVCGGRGLCGRCQIAVGEARLSSPTEAERTFAARRGLAADRRLGCQARLVGDLVVDVPPESQVHKQVVRKRAEARPVRIDPVVRLHYVEVREPDMRAPSGDLERLTEALREQWGLDVRDVDVAALRGLQVALRDGGWAATAVVRGGDTLIAVRPGCDDRAFGLAVDVGSTTLAAHLVDLATGEVAASAGAMNPQIRFGEDLMSRVSYATASPDGRAALAAAVREALDELAGIAFASAGVGRDEVFEAVVVGNPVMLHVLLGLDPSGLGAAPFALATDRAVTVRAGEIGLGLAQGARAYLPPAVAGHVGADAAAMILSEAPHRSSEVTLLVDVGTNAELVLGNEDRLLAASSPTGPAFEGAQISCGQRATPGAIERVRIDPRTLEPRFKVIGCDLWSDEPGFAEAVAGLGLKGVCGSGIIEAVVEMLMSGVLTADGVIRGDMGARTARIRPDGRGFAYVLNEADPELAIRQADVRAVQLAKAALYAGAQLLMDRLGVKRVERVVLAGAFGSHVDVAYAMALGMIPDCDLAKVSAAGNAAGTGARIALVDRGSRREIEEVVRRVEKVETAVEPRFQEHFVAAMAIPHATDRFESLAPVLRLPPRRPAGGRVGRRRGRGQ